MIDTVKFLKYHNSTVIIASHGEYAEDGFIQEYFERNKIPYTGSNSGSCRLCMDKTASQRAVSAQVKTIPTYKTYKRLEFPFIAKPNNLGSSIGVYLIKNRFDLEEYKKYFDDKYIYQPFISGIEVSQATVRENGGYLKLFPTEIIPNNEFFDYKCKYSKGFCKEITPARIGNKVSIKIMEVANEIHNSLGLGYYSRSDFILTPEKDLFYLETNALPGMTETSLVPQQLRYSNLMQEFKYGLINNLIG